MTAAAAGGFHIVALKPDGSVAAWGDNSLGQCAVPPGLSNVAAVAAGDFYSMVLKADGTVATWGGMGNSEVPAPDVLTNGIAIAAGAHHALALKADGTVAAWGDNWLGQCNVPAGLSDVLAVAAGDLHSVALRADGTLAVWGDGVPAWMREQIGLLSGVASVAAGGSATVAVKADGTVCLNGIQNLEDLQGAVVVAVGGDGNIYALMPDGTLAISYEGALPASDHPGVRIVAIDAGPMSALALGVVQAAAPVFSPAPGRLFTDRLTFTLSNVTEGAEIRYTLDGSEPTRASRLYSTSLVLNATALIKARAYKRGMDASAVATAGYWKQAGDGLPGTVVAWGDGHGQCTVPAGLSNVVAVAAGSYHTLALKSDGTVAAWGVDGLGLCDVPVGLSDVVAVSAGQAHSVALKADGTVKAWGPNWGGECDVPEGLSTVVAVSAGAHHTVALTASGTLVAWGENGAGQCAVPKDLSDVTAVVAGAFHTVALKADGTVTAWGHNGVGQCDVPKGLSKVVAVAAGASHTVALQADGTLVAWGTNDLGIGEVPSGLAPAVAVAAGYGHTLALRASGGLTAWGANWQGQCDVPALSLPVVAFAGGEYHSVAVVTEAAALPVFAPTSGTLIPSGGTLEVTLSCAAKDVEIRYTLDGSVPTESSPLYAAPLVLSSLTVVKARAFMPGGTGNRMATATYMKQAGAGVPGTVVAWGSNWSGQCQVPAGLSNSVAAVAAGYAFTLALKTDGTVAAWGEGDKDGGPCAVPAGLSNVVAVAAGDYSALALRADGTVAAWGGNDFGQCNVPAGLSDVVAVASGSALSLALRRDGTVVAWGANWFGQTTVPAGLANVVAIAAGGYHAVALKADGTVVAWGDNEKGLFDVPAGLRDVVAVAAGGYFTAALKRDGTVVQWGVDFYGRFVVPAGLTGVIDISGGKKDGIVALKSDGTVVGWGPDDYGRYDVPEGLSNVVAVAAGQTHTVALVSVVVVEAPVLAVTPHELAVAAMAGEAAFNVTNSAASGRPLIWKASVVSGDWARVVSGMVGTNSGVVSVAYGANADGSPERQAVVRVHAVGSTNGVDVTVTQAASRTTPLSDFVATHPGVPFRSAGGAWYHSEAEGRDAIRSAVPSRGGAASLTATVQGPGLLSFDWKLNTSTHDIGSAMTMSLASRVIESYVAGGVGRVTLAVPSGLQKITWTVRRGAVAGEVYGCVKSATWQPLLAVPADSAQPWSGCALRSGRVDGLAWGAPVLPREGTSGFRLFAGWRMRALTLVCETQEAFVAKDQFAAVLSKAGARPFYWRVDTFVKDGRGREAASRGSLWNLTALPDDVPQFVSVPQDGSSGAEPADEFPAVTLYAGVACSLGPFSVESSSLSARVAVAATGLPSGLSVGVASEAGVTVSGVPSAVAAGLSGRTYRTVLQLVEFRNGVARQGAAAAMTVTVLPLGRAAGTYTGFMDDGQSRRGLSSMTVQTDGAISGRVKIGAANYMFSAKAFEGITNGNFYAHMVAKTDMAATPSEYPLDLEVSPEGGVTCMFDRSLDALILARNNWKEPGMATLLRDRYEGYYTVAVPRAGETASEVFPGGTGYLTMTVAAAGEVKIAGVLADGVSVSGATTLLYSTDDDTAYVPVYLTPSAYKTAGSGLFVLMAVSNGAASAKDPSGRRLNSLSGSGTWVNRDPWCVYGYASGMESNRMGFAEEVVARGGYYDKTQNLQDYYAGQALRFSGEAAYLEALDFGGMDGSTGYLLDQLPNGVDVAVSITGASILKLTLPPRSNVYTPGTWLTDFDASTNPWNVKLNAVKATGVISGSFNLFFAGGEDPAHKTKMVSLKGILLPHRGPSWETDDQAEGFYLFPDVGAYLDPQGVERTYPFNWSRGFRLSP